MNEFNGKKCWAIYSIKRENSTFQYTVNLGVNEIEIFAFSAKFNTKHVNILFRNVNKLISFTKRKNEFNKPRHWRQYVISQN